MQHPRSRFQTLKLVDVPRPSRKLRDGEVLIDVLYAALNPADYKFINLGIASRAIASFPKIPGMDVSGRVTAVAPDVDDVKPGDLVSGRLPITNREGSLCESVILNRSCYATLPADFKHLDQAAGLPSAALTAYQTMHPHLTSGDKVFVNGGSGGVGFFNVQIAKLLGCHITVTCSTAKADQCQTLGADDIIDYKTSDVIAELRRRGETFHLAIDNVGNSPPNLYAQSHHFLQPSGRFTHVGGAVSCSSFTSLLRSLALPKFLGGGRRPFSVFNFQDKRADLVQLVQWLAEGKLKTIIDKTFSFEEVPQAFEYLRKGSSAGKVIIQVAEK